MHTIQAVTPAEEMYLHSPLPNFLASRPTFDAAYFLLLPRITTYLRFSISPSSPSHVYDQSVTPLSLMHAVEAGLSMEEMYPHPTLTSFHASDPFGK